MALARTSAARYRPCPDCGELLEHTEGCVASRLDETRKRCDQLESARQERHDLIYEALDLGLGPSEVARLSGLDISRVRQLIDQRALRAEHVET